MALTMEKKRMTSEAYTVGEVDDLGHAPSHCSNCDWKGKASETGNIGSCCLMPGDPSPVGRCPSCDSLAYVDQRPVRIVIGLALIGLAVTGTVGIWGWIGIVPRERPAPYSA